MFRIDDPTAAAALPAPETAGTEAYFTEGAPGTTPATLVRASWLNMIQEELRAIVVAGAIAPSKTVYNQVLLGLKALFGQLATVNAWTKANRGTVADLGAVAAAGTITPDFSASNNFKIGAISGSFTLANPTNKVAGQSGFIECNMNATGGYAVTYGTDYIGALGVKPTLQALANGTDVLYYVVLSSLKIVVSSSPKVS